MYTMNAKHAEQNEAWSINTCVVTLKYFNFQQKLDLMGIN